MISLQLDFEELFIVIATCHVSRACTQGPNLDTALGQNVKYTALKLRNVTKCSCRMIVHSDLIHKWEEYGKSNEC